MGSLKLRHSEQRVEIFAPSRISLPDVTPKPGLEHAKDLIEIRVFRGQRYPRREGHDSLDHLDLRTPQRNFSAGCIEVFGAHVVGRTEGPFFGQLDLWKRGPIRVSQCRSGE